MDVIRRLINSFLGIEYTKLGYLSLVLLQIGLIVPILDGMEEGQKLLGDLVNSSWTYAAIAGEMGIHWHTVKRWHSGESRVSKVVAIGLSTLFEKEPPPKRRYGPDAPQRQSKKYLVRQ